MQLPPTWQCQRQRTHQTGYPVARTDWADVLGITSSIRQTHVIPFYPHSAAVTTRSSDAVSIGPYCLPWMVPLTDETMRQYPAEQGALAV